MPRSTAEKRKGTVDAPKYQMVSQAAISNTKMWQRYSMKKVRLGLRSPIFSTVARSSRKSSTSFFCGEIRECLLVWKCLRNPKRSSVPPSQGATVAMVKRWVSLGDKPSLRLRIMTRSQGEASDQHSGSGRAYHFMYREFWLPVRDSTISTQIPSFEDTYILAGLKAGLIWCQFPN